MDDFEYQVEMTTRDISQFVAKDYNYNLEQALSCVYNSKTYEKLNNKNTGLFFQSPLYVYEYLKEELKSGPSTKVVGISKT
ncbi:MAG: hypothetical protein HUK24_03235 [Sphaerochaetaceae bacterium]|nr:hypothetical protein [Sphaerochaetaceae bacterium]